MIIEGCITCGICIAAFVLVIDFPDKADGFLNPREKAFVMERINVDRGDAEQDVITGAKVLHHLKDWKLYCWSFLIFSAVVPGFSYNFYTPLILREGMGFSASDSLLLTAPPFVCAAVLTFLSSLISDKTRLRGPVLLVHHTLAITGMFITAYVKNPAARYFGVFLGKWFLLLFSSLSLPEAPVHFFKNGRLGRENNSNKQMNAKQVLEWSSIAQWLFLHGKPTISSPLRSAQWHRRPP